MSQDYFKIDAWSHSAQELFRQSTMEYHARYEAKVLPDVEATSEMRIGTWTHMAKLEPEKWASVRVIESRARRKRVNGAMPPVDLTEITVDERSEVLAHAAAIELNPKAKQILDGAEKETEFVIVWTDEETGVLCKGKLDLVLFFRGVPILVADIKKVPDVKGYRFRRTMEDRGFHRQGAHYLAGIKHKFGVDVPYVIIASTMIDRFAKCVCFDVPEYWLAIGRQENRADMLDLARRRETNDWMTEEEKSIQTVEANDWGRK